MDAIQERLERRRKRAAPLPGATEGAHRLFKLYYKDASSKARDKLLLALAEGYPEARDPLQRAADLCGKWARGKRVPTLPFRRLLSRVAGIPQKAWEEQVAA